MKTSAYYRRPDIYPTTSSILLTSCLDEGIEICAGEAAPMLLNYAQPAFILTKHAGFKSHY
jgi:hypothetical protein